ncbi:MAG: aminotransferase class I/II-fold pyridoxal phosphate-dependent enzyme [Candidatus Omnitrophica bacterium]|nr:aminotransferase class I/II-fold pyridoxal phosphate-dependent enzyme [Candidatus Omnitrophota bacterium]
MVQELSQEMLIDFDNVSLADYYEYDSADIFEKTRRYRFFMDECRKRQYHFWGRILETPSASHVIIRDPYDGTGREMIMMASNNYLGLTTHPKVMEAGIKAIKEYGAGAGSVPLLGGTHRVHRELEEKLARMKSCESAVLFSSGYVTNVGCIAALLRAGDVAFNDLLNHASIIDGCKLSGAKLDYFRHNDMRSLTRVLKLTENRYKGKLVVVDGVYSMDGDICNLPEILDIAHLHGACVMIDEAHATGVIGDHGRGTPEYFHLEGKTDIVAGTLSKALGGVGGFVASKKEVVEYLRYYARGNMFSTALPPATAASVSAAIDVIENEPEIRQKLWRNIRYMTTHLRSLGFNLGGAQTAIIPVIIGDQPKLREMSREIHKAGVFVNYVYYPAVPKRLSRIRLSLMATHTEDDLDKTLEVLEQVGRKYGVID